MGPTIVGPSVPGKKKVVGKIQGRGLLPEKVVGKSSRLWAFTEEGPMWSISREWIHNQYEGPSWWHVASWLDTHTIVIWHNLLSSWMWMDVDSCDLIFSRPHRRRQKGSSSWCPLLLIMFHNTATACPVVSVAATRREVGFIYDF